MRSLPLGAVIVAGCSFAADHGGTAYLCGGDGACPPGHVCQAGRCLPPGSAPDAAPPEVWWDDDWRARRALVVTNQSDGPLAPGYQIGWMVDIETELGEQNVDAVRLVRHTTGQDVGTEIPRVVDGAVVPGEVVWFPLEDGLERGQQTTVWIYFDSQSPPPAPWDGGDVFELADPFVDVSPERWVTEGPIIAEGTAARFDSGSEMRSADPVPVDRALDLVVRVSDTASRLWFGFQRELPDFEPDVPWMVWIRREVNDAMFPEYAGPKDTLETRWAGAAVGVGAEDHIYSVERLLDRVVYQLDYALARDDHDHALDEGHSAPLFIRFSNTGSSSFWLSRARIRHVAYPAPELRLGDREERPTP